MGIPNSKKSPLVTMGRPIFAPKITSSRWPIPKRHYLSHPWTRPTYHAKGYPDPNRHFSTMHWTDTQINRWLTGMFGPYSPLMLYRQQRGLIVTSLSCKVLWEQGRVVSFRKVPIGYNSATHIRP